MSEIALDNVTKRFPDGTMAVREAKCTIHDGEFFILVGPSGCGKSTLLNMIAGLESVSSGEIRVDGSRINDVDPKDRNMAMVFQSYAIYPHMSVRENIAFPLKLAKLPRGEIRRRVEDVARALELTDLLERRPASLSGGQRQRVAMGRAIVREPVAFLMDEPLSNLDAKLRVQMRTELARLQRRLATTTVYVTHDQTEAMTLGDRVAVMRDGEIEQIGTPRELYDAPQTLFVAGFIGSPSMNLFPARIESDRLVLPMGELAVPVHWADLPREPGRLTAGIRPEHLAQAGAGNKAKLITFDVEVDVLEWLGADLFAYFNLAVDAAYASPRNPTPARARDGTVQAVARLDVANDIVEGQTLSLSCDPAHLHLFDTRTGERLTPVRD